MQEHDYLKNTVARISAMKPDIVIVSYLSIVFVKNKHVF